MLQQTQTSRVVEPWRRFLEAFPTPDACAKAPLAAVLRQWAGLGYHRRAKALHDSARLICERHDGWVPSEVAALRSLPGVGEYTANAVASFAFGAPVAVLDTNVGRVLARAVENRTLRPKEARHVATSLLPRESAPFNQSMLDLGARFCRSSPRCTECPLQRVCRWRVEGGEDPAPQSAGVSRRQSAFEGSTRQLRGRLLAALRDGDMTRREFHAWASGVDDERMDGVVADLIVDGLVESTKGRVSLVKQ